MMMIITYSAVSSHLFVSKALYISDIFSSAISTDFQSVDCVQNLLRAINRMGPNDSQGPKRPVRIVDCTAADVKKYELSAKDMEKDDLEEGK